MNELNPKALRPLYDAARASLPVLSGDRSASLIQALRLTILALNLAEEKDMQ